MMKNFELCLQLFAEGADGDTAHDTGVTEVAAAPSASGETEASAAGMQDLGEEFAQLIKGKYKDAYNSRVRETLQKRLREQKELTEKMEALSPVISRLEQRCGVKPGDISAQAKAVETLQTLPDRATAQQSLWADQAAKCQSCYPGFNLGEELKNPVFRKLLQSDVPVQTAYEVLHKDQLLPAAMAHTARTVEQKLCSNLAAMGTRPSESAMGNPSPNPVRSDVSQMSRAERSAIIGRVRKGETIRF